MDEAVDNLSELDECNNIEDAEYVLELKEAVLTLELRYCELDVYEVEGTSLELLEVDEVDEVEETSLKVPGVDEDETGSGPCKSFPRTPFLVVVVDVVGVVEVVDVVELELELASADTGQQYCGKSAFEWF